PYHSADTAGLVVHLAAPGGGQGDLVISEKGKGEDHEDHEEDHVQGDVGGDVVQHLRVYRIQQVERKTEKQINEEDEESIQDGIHQPLFLVGISFREKGNRERDHRKHAGSEQGYKSAHKAEQEDVQV